MQFRLFHNIASEREYHPIVFTPPRDDFGMLGQPRKFDDEDEDEVAGDEAHPTRQAICMVTRVVCCFAVAMIGIVLFYMLESWIVGETIIYPCKHQKLEHGVILPGQEGARPVVTCDKGYMVGAPVEFRCYKLSEHCVVTKKATVIREEVKKCWRQYAFVTDKMGETVLRNDTSNSTSMEQLYKKYSKLVPNACLEDPSQQQKGKAQSEDSARLYIQSDSTLGGFLGRASKQHIAAALVAMVALIMVLIMVTLIVFRRSRCPQIVPNGACPNLAREEIAGIE